MKLSIKERIYAMSVLPKQANFAMLKIVKGLEDELSFSEKEIADLEIKVNSDQMSWSMEKEKQFGEKEINIGVAGTEIIRSELKKLDESKSLTKDHISLCEKFEL